MAVSQMLNRLKGVAPSDYWHLTSLAKAPQELGLEVEHHDDGSLTTRCHVCGIAEKWAAHEWMDDLIMVHHAADCLLMTPISSVVH